jgi:serine protease
MIDAAAISYLGGQNAPLEVQDPIALNSGTNNQRQNELATVPEAWAQGYTGAGQVIAVLDDGTALSHPDLNDNLWVNPGEIANDGIDNDQNGYIDDIFGWNFVSNNNSVVNTPITNAPNSQGTEVAGMTLAESTNNNISSEWVGCRCCQCWIDRDYDR